MSKTIRSHNDNQARELNREAVRRYRAKNLEQLRIKDRDAQRRLRAANPEKYIALSRRRYRADPEKAREQKRRYRAANLAKVKAAHRRWYVEHPVNAMLANAKARAKVKGLLFSLKVSDIKIPDTCPLLEIPMAQGEGAVHDGSPALDRIDNTKGYVPGNVQVISWRANTLKRDATLGEFQTIVRNWQKQRA